MMTEIAARPVDSAVFEETDDFLNAVHGARASAGAVNATIPEIVEMLRGRHLPGGVDEARVRAALETLAKQGVLGWDPPNKA